MDSNKDIFGWHAHVRGTLALLILVELASWSPGASSDDPKQVEVSSATAVLTYLDGSREQRAVERGHRLEVVRRLDTYYVVKDGDRQALVALANVIAVKTPAAKQKWEYVVTTANAAVSVKSGRRSVPEQVEQGEVFEVLGRPRIGSTLYILLDDGRTAEIAANLVRTARPEERPPPPRVGRIRGPVPLGCEISIDTQRCVRVEFAYPDSLGERIGLLPGIAILEVNGEAVHSAADYDRESQLLGGDLRLLVRQFGLDYPEMLEYRDPRNARARKKRD